VQLTKEAFTNDFKPNINNKYKGEVIDKTTNQIILTIEDKNISKVIEFMSGFNLNKYSRKITGKYIYLWEA
tara:strand:- start:450 stop:662 length:213 start_codon:yes stop_codon:yes gene_type:complete